MENSVPVHQNGIETPRTGETPVTPVTSATLATPVTPVTPVTSATSVTSSLKPCSVSVSPLVIPAGSKLLTTTANSASSFPGFISAKMPSTQTQQPVTPMEVTPVENQGEGPLQTNAQVEPLLESQDQVLSGSDNTAQMKEVESPLVSSPKTSADSKNLDSTDTQTPESSSVQTVTSSQLQAKDSSQSGSSSTVPCEPKELQEGQEIYIQTEGMTVQLAEPGLDRIVIVNGPDGTTMHIQTPEGVPLEAVQALLGIEASDGAKAPQ